MVWMQGVELANVEVFKRLVSTIQSKGKCEREVMKGV